MTECPEISLNHRTFYFLTHSQIQLFNTAILISFGLLSGLKVSAEHITAVYTVCLGLV